MCALLLLLRLRPPELPLLWRLRLPLPLLLLRLLLRPLPRLPLVPQRMPLAIVAGTLAPVALAPRGEGSCLGGPSRGGGLL